MRLRAKVDSNQKEIVKALRQIPGVSVYVTSMVGKGFPDLIIGYRFKNYLIEIKDGAKPKSKQQLTEDEKDFKHTWQGQYNVCNSLDDILFVLGI